MDRSAVLATKIRAAFAPCSLGAWPTPLESQPALARALGLRALWLKREDRAGGNKVRGLEFLLAGAPPRSVFVTIGGAGSSHCLATATHAKAQGYRTAVALFAQPETEASRAVAAATAATANLVVSASSLVTLPWALLRAWRAAHHLGRGMPRWIPGGGADPHAVIGHLVAWLGWSTEVVAVRVAPRIVANRWRTLRLARKTAALLRQAGVELRVPHSGIRVRVVDAMGEGYGHPTLEGERARALAAEHGIKLDPTYGAKAFSYFLQRATGNPQRAVFWHTFAWP